MSFSNEWDKKCSGNKPQDWPGLEGRKLKNLLRYLTYIPKHHIASQRNDHMTASCVGGKSFKIPENRGSDQ